MPLRGAGNSAPAVGDKGGRRVQQTGTLAVRFEQGLRLLDQPGELASRPARSVQRNQRTLARSGILAGRLADGLLVGRKVEQIVRQLERQPDCAAELRQALTV